MESISRNVTALIKVGVALACVTMIVLWPEWRAVLHAQGYEEFTCTTTDEIRCTEELVDLQKCDESQVTVCIGEAEMIDESPSAILPETSSASSQDTKRRAQRFAAGTGIVAIVAGVVGTLACAATPLLPACIGIAAAVGGLGIEAIIMDEIGNDPPDPNFTVIAVPQIPTVPPLLPDNTLTLAAAAAFNALFANQAAVIGLERAILTSVERAQGAFNAGRGFWQIKQLQTAELYARELAVLLDRQPSLLNSLRIQLALAGISVNITPADVLSFQQQVASSGLPASLVQALTAFGADRTLIDKVEQLIVEQDPSTAAGNFPGMLVSRELFDAFHNLASTLSEVNPLKIVNNLVSFTPDQSTFMTTTDTTGCFPGFVGKFSFNAILRNQSTSSPLSNLIVQVGTLANGNLLLNADRGPEGVGAIYTLTTLSTLGRPLNPGESNGVLFEICLKQKGSFQFSVDVFGQVLQ